MSDLTHNQIYLAAEAAARAINARHPTFKAGIIDSLSLEQNIANVFIDGDSLMTDDGGNDDIPVNGWAPCQILYGSGLQPGDRVMVMFAPPNGAFVVGRYSGDFNPWFFVGNGTPAPPFEQFWHYGPNVGLPGQAGTWQIPGFRRIGRIVELRGRAARNTGGAPNPDTVFYLPVGYRPLNDIAFPSICGPIAIPAYVVVGATGAVQAFLTGGTTVWADGGFISLDGCMFSVDPPAIS